MKTAKKKTRKRAPRKPRYTPGPFQLNLAKALVDIGEMMTREKVGVDDWIIVATGLRFIADVCESQSRATARLDINSAAFGKELARG